MSELVLLAGYVASLLVLVAHIARHFPQGLMDGCNWWGYAAALFLLMCPGINTVLAIDTVVGWITNRRDTQ